MSFEVFSLNIIAQWGAAAIGISERDGSIKRVSEFIPGEDNRSRWT